jgi:two-component system, LytTR family, sensor kinase
VLDKIRYSWLFKYKLHHLPFWLLYHYLFWALAMDSFSGAAYSILHTPFVVKYIFYAVFQAMGVYFNLYFLIPRFLERGRYVLYMALLVVTIVVTAAVIVNGYYLVAFVVNKPFQELFGRDPSDFYYFFKTNSLPSTLAAMTLGMSIKLTKNWIQSKRRQQMLETEKLETELKFLRSQLNPHFIFNAINSIFFLIHKNPAMASDALAKFSDLLRYQLYESNELQIPLSQEVTYLENFIELERLRQSHRLELHLDIQEQGLDLYMIAPFVLITFTENAFKHVSDDTDKPNWIKLRLEVKGLELYFKIVNTMSAGQSMDVVRYGGIGLNNVRRRLDLIYPGQHVLNISDNGALFEVELRVKLTEAKENNAKVMRSA